ncbi:MAG: hypothetical protein V8S08_02045 [Lachnoclostridium sp.]
MQQLQMTTQEGGNVFVCAVNGNFAAISQTGVKRIFADAQVKEKLLQNGVKLSSANSINWGRLVPQIVYYFSAYADWLKQGHPGRRKNQFYGSHRKFRGYFGGLLCHAYGPAGA